jgi:hypothetical protein
MAPRGMAPDTCEVTAPLFALTAPAQHTHAAADSIKMAFFILPSLWGVIIS